MSQVTINLKTTCKGCGRSGATDSGFCLTCLGALQTDPAVPATPAAAPLTEPRPLLDVILAGLIARSEEGRAEQNHRLSHGLFLGIQSQPGESLTLKIWRYNQAPSALEWTTTITHLPEMYRPTAPIVPRDYTQGRLQGLTAAWPIPARLF